MVVRRRLTDRQWKLLWQIAFGAGVTCMKLSKRSSGIFVINGTGEIVTEQVRPLVDMGLIRSRPPPCYVVSLTKKGRAWL